MLSDYLATMFPVSLVVAHQQTRDLRKRSKCIIFPYEKEPSVVAMGETMGLVNVISDIVG